MTDFVIEKSEKHKKVSSALFLKDRGILRYMILSGDIESAKNLIQTKFKTLYDSSVRVQAYLDVLTFVGLIGQGELEAAVNYSVNLSKYTHRLKKIKIPTKYESNKD